ncbi:hypothetical protein [Arcobacter sp. LA11]|uniref:hypothetical protein n=1 Tax=Arcobacter sp. LA11 TaxID=1898176 RepID=UPI000B0E6E81|nr:hypothetical protein [Arcobacter sp. LA11]
MKPVGKLFNKVPYLVRDIHSKYKSIHEVEEVISDFMSYYMLTIDNLIDVFSNNRDNISNFHIKVNTKMPEESVYVDFHNDELDITFEESKDNKTINKKVNSLIIIDTLKQEEEYQLIEVFDEIMGCDGKKLFISFTKEKLKLFDPKSKHYNYRKILIEKKEYLENISNQFSISCEEVYQELYPNIVKAVCKDLNITYKVLAQEIGYKADTINKAASTNKISEQIYRAIEMYLENLRLKEELKDFETMRMTLRKILV